MEWTALGAIGELVGGVVVVITLIYLAAQIRQNTKATRAHATAYVASEMERNLLAVAENRGLAEPIQMATEGADLPPVDRLRVRAWWGSFVRNAESHYLQAHLGTMSEDVLEPFAAILRQLVQIPILKELLQEMIDQEIQTKAFRVWVVEHVLS
jgi:hypothetical protein